MSKFTKVLPYLLMCSIGLSTAGYTSYNAIKDVREERTIEDEEQEETKHKATEVKKEEKNEDNKTIDNYLSYEGLTVDDLNELVQSGDLPDYSLFIDNYNDYINSIAHTIKDITTKRDIVADAAIYHTMLKSGSISYGEYNYSKPEVSLVTAAGANVAAGESLCWNNAHNMCDVFLSLGYDARVVIGKCYKKGEEKPVDANHAVLYVSDGDFAYVIDPTNDTIFLRHKYMVYYSAESQESNFLVFEPELKYESDYYGKYTSYQLIGDFGNDFKKHWDVLRAYRNYKEAAEAFIDRFLSDEQKNLVGYEESMKTYLDGVKERKMLY